MRTYEATHPWLSFRWDPRHLPSGTWVLLGELSALGERLARTALPASEGHEIGYRALLNGVLANAALDGNGLASEQVHELFEGELELPRAQQYLRTELENLVLATRQIRSGRIGSSPLDPWALLQLHAQMMKGLPWSDEARPGEFRSVRTDITADGGIPAPEVPGALERLFDWLNGPAFDPTPGDNPLPVAVIRALLGHLYIQWIRPFAEGNGRIARLVQYRWLTDAGLPPATAHRFTVQAAATRQAYDRQLRSSMQAGGDPVGFITFMVRHAVDGSRALLADVDRTLQELSRDVHLDRTLVSGKGAVGVRHLKLIKALYQANAPCTPARIVRLDPELTAIYARLNPKTLQRDLVTLQQHLVVERTGSEVKATDEAFHPFRNDLLLDH